MKLRPILVSLCILIGLASCQASDNQETSRTYSAKANEDIPQHLAEEAKRTVVSMERVDDAVSVVLDENVYVAINVNGFDRFFLKEIRKEAKEKLKKAIPGGKIEVSTDKKIDIELTEIEQALQRGELSKKDLKKKIKKVKEDLKG